MRWVEACIVRNASADRAKLRQDTTSLIDNFGQVCQTKDGGYVKGYWQDFIKGEFQKDYMVRLMDFVEAEAARNPVYPDITQVFRAFELTPFEQTKVVIIGQDPYYNEGQANGLAFSVPPGEELPPSLLNIYKEIEDDLGIKMDRDNGDLEPWAKQGVLLLNTCLTVSAGKPASHQGKGWERFTDSAIKELAQSDQKIIFLLWGNFAKKKAELIDENRHIILKAAHPSPLSAHNGFFKCGHFGKVNKYLKQMGKHGINWEV